MYNSPPPSRSASLADEKWLEPTRRTSFSIAETSDTASSKDVEAEIQETTDGLGKTFTGRISQISQPSVVRQVTTNGTTSTSHDPLFEVDWASETDPNNPKNWPFPYKCLILFFLSWNTLLVYVYQPIMYRCVSWTDIYIYITESSIRHRTLLAFLCLPEISTLHKPS